MSRWPKATRDRAAALSIFAFLRDRLAPGKRVRRIEFVAELPKTLSGKSAASRCASAKPSSPKSAPGRREYRIEDFPELG